MAGAAVECESVSRSYRRGSRALSRRWLGRSDERPRVRALSDVDLSVQPDEFVGIAGPSGSGKSTLLHLLAALDEPTAGRVVVGDTDVASLSGRARTRFRRDRVGVVFQHFHLLPSLSARANVALPLVERGVPKSTRRARAEELLAAVDLGDRAAHRPTELSGGEQQRVAIARALATDPPLVVADEPTGELDSATAERVLDVLASIGEKRTVLLASHDRQALARADRVVRLQDGEVAERDGSVRAPGDPDGGLGGVVSGGVVGETAADDSETAASDGEISGGTSESTDSDDQLTDKDGEPIDLDARFADLIDDGTDRGDEAPSRDGRDAGRNDTGRNETGGNDAGRRRRRDGRSDG